MNLLSRRGVRCRCGKKQIDFRLRLQPNANAVGAAYRRVRLVSSPLASGLRSSSDCAETYEEGICGPTIGLRSTDRPIPRASGRANGMPALARVDSADSESDKAKTNRPADQAHHIASRCAESRLIPFHGSAPGSPARCAPFMLITAWVGTSTNGTHWIPGYHRIGVLTAPPAGIATCFPAGA